VIYKHSPGLYHASSVVIVETAENKVSWQTLLTLNRIAGTASKVNLFLEHIAILYSCCLTNFYSEKLILVCHSEIFIPINFVQLISFSLFSGNCGEQCVLAGLRIYRKYKLAV
jgi:hypothetical protein